jgi:hypothetical protein
MVILPPAKKLKNSFISHIWLISFIYFLAVYVLWKFSSFQLEGNFDSSIGGATLDNIDIGARVRFFYKSGFLFFPLVYLSLVFFQKTDQHSYVSRFFGSANQIAIFSIVFLLSSLEFKQVNGLFGIFFLMSIIVFHALKFLFRRLSDRSSVFLSICFSLIPLALCNHYTAPQYLLFFFISGWVYLFINLNSTEVFRKLIYNKKLLAGILVAMLMFVFVFASHLADLYDFVKAIIRHGNATNISPYAPFALVTSIILLIIFVTKIYSGTSVKAFQWLALGLFYICTQICKDYFLESSILLLTWGTLFFFFFKKNRSSHKRVLYCYTSSFDFIISLSILCLLNECRIPWVKNSSEYIVPIVFIILQYVKEKHVKQNNIHRYYSWLAALVFTPWLIVINQELFSVLNNRSVFVGLSCYYVSLGIQLAIIFICFNYYPLKRVSFLANLFFIAAISGFAVYGLYTQKFAAPLDWFESASHSNAIKRLFAKGQIPLLETYSPHNFDDYLTGLLYPIFNNGQVSLASRIYFCLYGILFIPGYLFLRKIFESRFLAFFIVFTHSLFVRFLPIYFGLILIPILLSYSLLTKKRTAWQIALTGGLFLFVAFFRPDMGMSFVLTSIVIWSIFYFVYRPSPKKLIFPVTNLVIIPLLLAAVTLIYAYRHNIDVRGNCRLILNYLQSYQSWGLSDLGLFLSYRTITEYFLFPFVILVIFFLLLLVVFQKQTKPRFYVFALLFLCVYYLSNYQRGLVRYVPYLLGDDWLTSFWYFIIPLFCSQFLLKNRSKELKFSVFIAGSSILLFAFKYPLAWGSTSLYTASITKVKDSTSFELSESVINRSPLEQELYSPDYRNIDTLIRNGTLSPSLDEMCYMPMLTYFLDTEYLHFFNQGMHCYHNSVLQKKYIEELQKGECKTILTIGMPKGIKDGTSLDGVPHSVRNNDIYRWLYTHYQPAAMVDRKTIWVNENITIDTALTRIQSLKGNSNNFITDWDFHDSLRYIIRIYGKMVLPEDSIFINNSYWLPVEWYDRLRNVSYCFVDKKKLNISSFRLTQKVDSISVDQCHWFPPVLSDVPASFNLKYLPYVMGQSSAKPSVLCNLTLYNRSGDTSMYYVPRISREGLQIMISAKSDDKNAGSIKLQYFDAGGICGEYLFNVSKDVNAIYVLDPGYQYNWFKKSVTKIRVVKSKNVEVEELSFIKRNDL